MEKEKLTRGENRIIGGVCSTLAEKYNFNPWLLRIGLVLISIYFYYTMFIYLIAWLTIPNKVKVDNREQSKIYILSIVIGAVLGALLSGGLTYIVAILTNEPGKGGIAPLLVAIFGIPIGMIIGFSIVKAKEEKMAFKEQNSREI